MADEQTQEVAVVETEQVLSAVVQAEKDRVSIDLGVANTLVKSGFLPEAVKTPQQAVAIIWMGRELGLEPMASFQSIYVVHQRPAMMSNLMVALVRKSGLGKFKYESGENWCEVTGTRTDSGDTFTSRWDIKRAEASRVCFGKDGKLKDNWRNYQPEMLRHRCESEVCRTLFPDVIGNLYTPEELSSVSPPPEMGILDVQPSKSERLAEQLAEQAEESEGAPAEGESGTPISSPSTTGAEPEPERPTEPSEGERPAPREGEATVPQEQGEPQEETTIHKPAEGQAAPPETLPPETAPAETELTPAGYAGIMPNGLGGDKVKDAFIALNINSGPRLVEELKNLGMQRGIGEAKIAQFRTYLKSLGLLPAAEPPHTQEPAAPQEPGPAPDNLADRLESMNVVNVRLYDLAARNLGLEETPIEEMDSSDQLDLYDAITKLAAGA